MEGGCGCFGGGGCVFVCVFVYQFGLLVSQAVNWPEMVPVFGWVI